MTLRDTFTEVKRLLIQSGVDAAGAAFEAGCLLEKHTGLPPAQQLRDAGLPAACPEAFWADVRRRAAGEPLQYILGEWEFMGFRFAVGPGVLIPRPDTETLTQTALDYMNGRMARKPGGGDVLELCFGSGCVGISVALLCPDVRVRGVEISDEALGFAQRNIARHALEGRVQAVRGDMLVPPSADAPRVDALLCNPPYIRTREIAELDISVRGFEPGTALDGGPDGLRFYRAAEQWFGCLTPGGLAAFEVGYTQAEEVAKILRAAGLADVFTRCDCAGIERVVAGFAPA